MQRLVPRLSALNDKYRYCLGVINSISKYFRVRLVQVDFNFIMRSAPAPCKTPGRTRISPAEAPHKTLRESRSAPNVSEGSVGLVLGDMCLTTFRGSIWYFLQT